MFTGGNLRLIGWWSSFAEFPQYISNLLVMTQFVISDKRNCSHSVNVTKNRMLEDNVSEALVALTNAKCFQ